MKNFEVRISPISDEAKKEYKPFVAEVDAYAFTGIETGLKKDEEDAVAFLVNVSESDFVLAAVHELLVAMREEKPEMVDSMLRRALNGEKLE